MNTLPTMPLHLAAIEVAKQAQMQGFHKVATKARKVAADIYAPDGHKALIRQFAREWGIANVE